MAFPGRDDVGHHVGIIVLLMLANIGPSRRCRLNGYRGRS